MSQTVLLKASIAVATVRVLQGLLPAVIAGLSLWAIVSVSGAQFDDWYQALTLIATALTLAILQPPPQETPSLGIQIAGIAVSVLSRWAFVLVLLYLLGTFTGFSYHFSKSIVLTWAVIAGSLVFCVVLLLQLLMRRIVLKGDNQRRAVIVGVTDASLRLADKLDRHPELCTEMRGFFDDRSKTRLVPLGDFQMLGRLDELVPYVRREKIDIIFVALPIRHVQRVLNLLDALRDSTASIYYVPDLFVFDLIQSRTGEIVGVPVVAMCETPFYGYRGVMKRLTDIGFTLGIMIFALPLMAFIAILVRLSSPGPILFKQRRYGLNGEEILVYKFRSMRVTEDGDVIRQATKDDDRVTTIGRYLRRYSLDELPQLFNVFQGNMSLVGPRPHAVAHNEMYRKLIKGYMLRHKVLPGITGLAQVNGCRGETRELEQMQARVNFDLEYLRRWTPLLDLKIILLTAVQLFRDTKAY